MKDPTALQLNIKFAYILNTEEHFFSSQGGTRVQRRQMGGFREISQKSSTMGKTLVEEMTYKDGT